MTELVDNTPDSLVARWRGGDHQAAAQLVAIYGQRLVAVAEANLCQRLRGRVDGDDIVQSAFGSFFQRVRKGQFELQDAEQILSLLVKITIRKTHAAFRHGTAAQRDVHKELSADWRDEYIEAMGRDPSPDAAAVLMDEIERMLVGLPLIAGKILQQLLEGHRKTEIADNLGISRQTVYRMLDLLQQRLADG